MKSIFLVKNSHFLIATSICSSYSLFKTYLTYSLYSSSLSSYSYLALGVRTLGLLVILYIGTLLPKQPYIYNFVLRFYYNVLHKRAGHTSELATTKN
jgi:hypothetical protein